MDELFSKETEKEEGWRAPTFIDQVEGKMHEEEQEGTEVLLRAKSLTENKGWTVF